VNSGKAVETGKGNGKKLAAKRKTKDKSSKAKCKEACKEANYAEPKKSKNQAAFSDTRISLQNSLYFIQNPQIITLPTYNINYLNGRHHTNNPNGENIKKPQELTVSNDATTSIYKELTICASDKWSLQECLRFAFIPFCKTKEIAYPESFNFGCPTNKH
jgi:hypothetical protein